MPSAPTTPPTGPVTYAVLKHPADHEIEIKRSRFLCRLRRVDDEAAARAVIDEARAGHRTARHHCSAFVIGADQRLRRSNDDGEPAGTAGTPMLDALVQHSPAGLARVADDAPLSDVVAVVTRYFGGVLLGAGGLVRAYSDAVSSALDTATFGARERRQLFALDAPHADAGRWEHELRSNGIAIIDSEYGASGVRIVLAVPDTPTERDTLEARAAALTQGERPLEALGARWVDLG